MSLSSTFKPFLESARNHPRVIVVCFAIVVMAYAALRLNPDAIAIFVALCFAIGVVALGSLPFIASSLERPAHDQAKAGPSGPTKP